MIPIYVRTFPSEEARECNKLNESVFLGVLKLFQLDIPESLDVIRNVAVFDAFCLCSNQLVCIAREELERGKGKSADSNSQETGLFCFAICLCCYARLSGIRFAHSLFSQSSS